MVTRPTAPTQLNTAEQQLLMFPGFDTPSPRPTLRRDGPPCLKCGAATVLGPGKGPHYARVDRPDCKAWRWLARPKSWRPQKESLRRRLTP
jgi:hypothetical protein